MRIAKTALGIGLAVGALLGGTASASASAEPADVFYPYHVTAWHDVNVRVCASAKCDIDPAIKKLRAGETSIAFCWKHGQSITDFGITNDIWVVVSMRDANAGYVSALYLAGDERGGLPVGALCHD